MAEAKRRVGILGGTFDPIHIGHLMLAEAVRNEYDLEQVLFIPAAQPPHKLERKISSAEDRFMMTVLATCSNPAFEVSDIEMRREGPSYSVDTVRALIRASGGEDMQAHSVRAHKKSSAHRSSFLLIWGSAPLPGTSPAAC